MARDFKGFPVGETMRHQVGGRRARILRIVVFVGCGCFFGWLIVMPQEFSELATLFVVIQLYWPILGRTRRAAPQLDPTVDFRTKSCPTPG